MPSEQGIWRWVAGVLGLCLITAFGFWNSQLTAQVTTNNQLAMENKSQVEILKLLVTQQVAVSERQQETNMRLSDQLNAIDLNVALLVERAKLAGGN